MDSPIQTPELADPLQSSRVAASPAAKISETLIHEITMRFIARVIKRVPAGRRGRRIQNEGKCGKLLSRASTSTRSFRRRHVELYTNYIDER